MKQKLAIAVLAALAGALMLFNQEALAGDCCVGGFGRSAVYSSSMIGMTGWIELHRPDGESIHIQVVQILFVTSATNTGANKRARSHIQLQNGFADVIESVDEIMQSIADDNSVV